MAEMNYLHGSGYQQGHLDWNSDDFIDELHGVTPWVVLMFPNGGGTHIMLGEDEDRQNAHLLKHPAGHLLLFDGTKLEHAAAASQHARVHMVCAMAVPMSESHV